MKLLRSFHRGLDPDAPPTGFLRWVVMVFLWIINAVLLCNLATQNPEERSLLATGAFFAIASGLLMEVLLIVLDCSVYAARLIMVLVKHLRTRA